MQIRFWGVRGSIAVSGPPFAATGGNTACVEVLHEGQRLVLDGGTGLAALGSALGPRPVEGTVLFTHVHWDHIQGVPFFPPAFHPESRLRFLGAPSPSGRRASAFAKVDCAALPQQLIENELFGHERGAFTGADQATTGKVQGAQGGTLFLDEVGELPLPVQGKLLRLLQERVFFKVGGNQPLRADVRFVCATHMNLEEAVATGRFRQDLYYRMRVVEIRVPALHERGRGDLDRLVDHFLFEFTHRHGRPTLDLSEAARERLHAHVWPGNVRELEHCIESAVVLSTGPTIQAEELSIGPPTSPDPSAPAPRSATAFVTDLRPLRDVEMDYIRHVVEICGGNRSAAARLLGIGRNTLLRKLRP